MVEKIKNEIQDRGNIFWSLTLGIIIMTCFYIYFFSNTIYTTFQRQQTQRSIAALEEKADSLELGYLNLKNTVTIELAHAKGFKEIATTEYVSKKSSGVSLSLNTNAGI